MCLYQRLLCEQLLRLLPLLHPKMADYYREQVSKLNLGLRNEVEVRRMEAAEALRALISRIVLTPSDTGIEVKLEGDLAGILNISARGADLGERSSSRKFGRSKSAPNGNARPFGTGTRNAVGGAQDMDSAQDISGWNDHSQQVSALASSICQTIASPLNVGFERKKPPVSSAGANDIELQLYLVAGARNATNHRYLTSTFWV